MKVWQCAVWCVVVSVLMLSVLGVSGQDDAPLADAADAINATVAPPAETSLESGDNDGEEKDNTEPSSEPESEPEPEPTTAADKEDNAAGTMATSIPAMLGGLLMALRLHL